jgi:hypothetical protein
MRNKTTNPKNYLELLEVFRIALINGIIDKQEIVKWADEIIQSDSEPDYFIIEVSLSGHKDTNELVYLLNEYIGEKKPSISGRVLLGLLYKQFIIQQINLKKVVTAIYWLVWNGELNEKDKYLLYGLDNDYDLASSNITGSLKEVELNALEVLEMYKDFTIENYGQWDKINSEVEILVDRYSERQRMEYQKFSMNQDKPWWKLW